MVVLAAVLDWLVASAEGDIACSLVEVDVLCAEAAVGAKKPTATTVIPASSEFLNFMMVSLRSSRAACGAARSW